MFVGKLLLLSLGMVPSALFFAIFSSDRPVVNSAFECYLFSSCIPRINHLPLFLLIMKLFGERAGRIAATIILIFIVLGTLGQIPQIHTRIVLGLILKDDLISVIIGFSFIRFVCFFIF